MRQYPAASILTLEGPDAIGFAQAQFSSQVTTLAVGQWQFSAWLDPQGRVRALFHLARATNERLVLIMRGGDASTLVEGLQRFVFRSKVSIKRIPAAKIRTGPATKLFSFHDGNEWLLGCGDHSLLIGTEASDDTWRALHIKQGWPWLPDVALGQHLAPSLSLARIGATALDKGCYPGQEIVARLHYRGGNKRHMHCVVLSQRIEPGSVLRHDDRELASLLDVIDVNDQIVALAIMHEGVIDTENPHASLQSDEIVTITPTHQWPA